MIITYYIALVLIDSFLYGYILESRILRYNMPTGIWKFKINPPQILRWLMVLEINGEPVRYRIFQKILETGGLVLVYFYGGIYQLIAGCIMHYLQSFDMGYYIVMGQLRIVKEYVNPDWLTKWYTFGYFGYNYKRFLIAGTSGIIIAILSIII